MSMEFRVFYREIFVRPCAQRLELGLILQYASKAALFFIVDKGFTLRSQK